MTVVEREALLMLLKAAAGGTTNPDDAKAFIAAIEAQQPSAVDPKVDAGQATA